jgi:hypothetical protein
VTAILAVAAALALPQVGVLAPGQSLGGVHLGDTRAQVLARWGNDFGTCRDCRTPTLYFTYRHFDPKGAGVALKKNRVVAVFTLWQPTGWRTTRGLLVGDSEARATAFYGPLFRTTCHGYDAMTIRRRDATTAIYVRSGFVWGFGLLRRDEPVCRDR